MPERKFIGLSALEEVAKKVGTQIVMGPAYSDPSLLNRLRIKVISGLQYKQIETLLVRQGGTTRRKVVGDPLNNKIGFLKERTLEAKLSWNLFKDNIDNYVETNYGTNGKAGGSYPISTAACEAVLKTYAEDLCDNLFFGNMENDDNKALALYNGFHTLIAQDINDGYISTLNGNYIECQSIGEPTSDHDTDAYDIVMGVYAQLNPKLRKQKEILCYCDVKRGIYIAQAYANKYYGNAKVKYNEDGTFSIPEMPRVTFVPEDIFGEGDRLVWTIPYNLQYGVDTLDSRTGVKVKIGSDEDLQDVLIQIQSIQGTRILNPFASTFAVTNGSIAENSLSGDFNNSLLTISWDSTMCSGVTIDGVAYTKPVSYEANKTIKLLATAKSSSYKFVKWSNGSTDNPLTLCTTGMPMSITAICGSAT